MILSEKDTFSRFIRSSLAPIVIVSLGAASPALAHPPNPVKVVDLATVTAGVDPMSRAYAAGVRGDLPVGLGVTGVPVSGGEDIDGDGYRDTAVAHYLSSPLERPRAGEVHLIFGDGSIDDVIDLSAPQAGFLRIIGAGNLGAQEMAGTEIWMGDVTGDGVGDLLISRQNFSFAAPEGDRIGAGALTILVGGPEVRQLADAAQDLDLANPPPSVTLFHLYGAQPFGRLGIWARVGDLDGDGTSDLIVGADQESDATTTHHGAVYAVRGGAHLAQNAVVDLAQLGSTQLVGHLARVTPPAGSEDFHFGATNQAADLDGNGRAELMAAATLARAGAAIGPFGFGTHNFNGAPNGRLYIVWDDAFPQQPWPAGYHIDLGDPTVVSTTILGGEDNVSFGEEILGGLDYNGDHRAELFVGDLTGDGSPDGDRFNSGLGYVIYRAKRLKGRTFDIDDPPPGIRVTTILGPNPDALGSDTVAHGDFNGDGRDDLMIGSPHAHPQERLNAGAMHIFYGKRGGFWPRKIDLAEPLPHRRRVRVVEIQGANGATEGDQGDTLCYSAAAADLDGDGTTDLIVNEMAGNGTTPELIDAGNLIVLSGEFVSPTRHPGWPW